MLFIFNQNKKGFSMTEILIVVAISSIALLGILSLASFSVKQMNEYEKNTRAIQLATEMLEGARSVRDEDWSNITSPAIIMGANYHLVQAGILPDWYWELQPGNELVSNLYTRYVVFESISRDGSDNVEAIYNPVNDDPNTKKVKAIVSWPKAGASTQIEIATFLTNWQ